MRLYTSKKLQISHFHAIIKFGDFYDFQTFPFFKNTDLLVAC